VAPTGGGLFPVMAIPVRTVTQQLRILRRTATGMETLSTLHDEDGLARER